MLPTNPKSKGNELRGAPWILQHYHRRGIYKGIGPSGHKGTVTITVDRIQSVHAEKLKNNEGINCKRAKTKDLKKQ